VTVDGVIRPKWRGLVIEGAPDGGQRVNRINYEIRASWSGFDALFHERILDYADGKRLKKLLADLRALHSAHRTRNMTRISSHAGGR